MYIRLSLLFPCLVNSVIYHLGHIILPFPIPGTQVLSCQLPGPPLAVAPPMPRPAVVAVVVVVVVRRLTPPVFPPPWSALEPVGPAMMPWPPPLPLTPPLDPPDEGEPPHQTNPQRRLLDPGI